MEVRKVEKIPNLPKKLRVCAYARVSKEKESMIHSLNAQVGYYAKFIQKNNKWKYIGVYADEGISGTRNDRPEFQRMMEDARNGGIDLIVTKSVSRFARNVVTLLRACRELKNLKVDVFFEEQNLYLISAAGEMMLTLFASVAEEEAKNVSQHMRWRIQKDMERGMIWGGNDPFGYHIEKRVFSIIPEEAVVVKRIFKMYQSGMGDTLIAKKLNKEGVKSQRIGKWSKSTVRALLINPTYCGDLLLQKTYRPDYISKKYKLNKDIVPSYYVSDHHEGIVSQELYQECLAIRALRNETFKTRKKANVYPFTKMIKCGCCGSSFHHKVCTYQPKWMCKQADKMGKEYCTNKAIPERVLYKVVNNVLNLEEFDETIFKSKVKEMVAYPNNLLVFYFSDGTSKEVTWEMPSRKESWTEEMKEEMRRLNLGERNHRYNPKLHQNV